MPLYDFKCPKCGRVEECLVPSSHWDRLPCPTCNKLQITPVDAMPQSSPCVLMERQLSCASFVVNGHNAKNGYNGGQTREVKVKDKHMRVVVKS